MLSPVVIATVLSPIGWISRPQALLGTKIEDIQSSFKGEALKAGIIAQASTANFIWTYNPEGKIDTVRNSCLNPPANPPAPTEREKLMGLGGGITWAWDPKLWDKLKDRFKEDAIVYSNLVDLPGVKAAVSRAFNNWAGNNRFIHFIDVTAECDRLWPDGVYPKNGLTQAPFGQKDASGNALPDLEYHEGCPLAEIWVTDLKQEPSATGDIAVATAKQYGHMSNNFYYTNGERPYFAQSGGCKDYNRQVWSIHAGVMSIAVSGMIGDAELCWYLDSYFCSGIHAFKGLFGNPAEAKTVVVLVTWVIVCTCALYLFCIKFHAFLACWKCTHKNKERALDADGDGKIDLKERIMAFVEEASNWNPLLLALLLTGVIAPPLVLTEILLPCWDCADFEAAILHETGHFFGLGHPDYAPKNLHPNAKSYHPNPRPENSYSTFLAASNRLNTTSCGLDFLWSTVKPGIPPGLPADEVDLGKNGYEVRNSVMEAFTQHNPKPCLTEDDVEAITMLYPDCSEATTISQVVCPKVNHNIGLVRMAVFVLFPLMINLVCIVIFNSIMHHYINKELSHARKNVQNKAFELKRAQSAEAKAKRRESVMRFQKAMGAVKVEGKRSKGGSSIEDEAEAEFEGV